MRFGRIFGRIAWLLATSGMAAGTDLAGQPASDAASALVPFSGWVGSLPSTEAATWAERKLLAYQRGRSGQWMEAELQARSLRAAPVRHVEVCVLLARAARANRDWPRAAMWVAAARESLERVPADARTFDLVIDVHAEAVAVRAVADAADAFQAGVPFLQKEQPWRERFMALQRLVDLAVVAGDDEHFGKLAPALLQAAKGWSRETPADSGPGDADRALESFARSLVARGYAGVAAQLAEGGMADADLRTALARLAFIASVAQKSDAEIHAYLESCDGDPARLAALLGSAEGLDDGLVWMLVRDGRDALGIALLGAARELAAAEPDLARREAGQDRWHAVMQRLALRLRQVGRDEAVGSLVDVHADAGPAWHGRLVAFATLIGEHGLPALALRLLDSLPTDYPEHEDRVGAESDDAVEREVVADAQLQDERVALALAWAAAGDGARARDTLKRLPDDGRWATLHGTTARQRILGAITVAAAVAGDAAQAERGLEETREACAATFHASPAEALALVPGYVMLGRHDDAWAEIGDLPAAERAAVVARIVTGVIARGRGNRAIEWLSLAPAPQRREAWHAFFAAAAPEPDVWPVRPK